MADAARGAEEARPGPATDRPEGSREGHEGLAGTFHEKVISLDTMGLRLLAPTAVAIAIVVASAVLLGARDAGWPHVSVGGLELPGGPLMVVPLPVAVLATIAMILAWSFILAGALHAHLALRVVGVGAYSVMGLFGAYASGRAAFALIITLTVLSVVASAIGLYVADRGNHHQAPHLQHRVRLRLPTFGWILLATTLIYGLIAVSGLQDGYLGSFIDLELNALQFVLFPVLLLSATDFAEWAEVVSGRLTALVEKLPRAAFAGAVLVAGAGILFWAYVVQPGHFVFHPLRTAVDLSPVAILALPVCAAGGFALRRPLSTRVPFWALAAAALVLYLGFVAAGVAHSWGTTAEATPQNLPPLVAAENGHAPRYSLLVPQDWTRTTIHGGSVWSGTSGGRPARLILLWGPGAGDRSLSLAVGAPLALIPDDDAGGWQRASVWTTIRGQVAEGDVWTRRQAGETWILAGVRAGGPTAASRALFETVRGSFTTDPGAEHASVATGPDRYVLAWEGTAVLVLLASGLVLLVMGRGEVATGGLYLTLVALFAGFGAGVEPALTPLIGVHGLQPVTPLLLNIVGGFGAVGAIVLTSIVPGWRLPTRVLRLILVLTLGLAALNVLKDGVFNGALAAGAHLLLVQGVLLMAAMLWDLLMSGESFTNTGGLRVPRHTRVLIYMGYTLLMVTTVLFLSSEQTQGAAGAGQLFETDSFVGAGIAELGPPLLITFFLVNLRAWRRARRPTGRDGLDQVDRSILVETGRGT